MTTISVRVEDELMKRVDKVTDIVSFNKSDFLRACLEKLCSDNKLLVDHFDNLPQYFGFIRNELSQLPVEMIKVTNGSWKEVTDSTILILCDELWKTSEIVFNKWLSLSNKYNLTRTIEGVEIVDFSQATGSDGLLDLSSLLFHAAEKSGQVAQVDIPVLLNNENWIDNVEADRIILSCSVKEAFEEQPARTIIRKYLEEMEEEKHEEPLRLVIDAKGTFRRSGSVLYFPVSTEKIQEG
jgi:hypothetical protein